MTESVSTALADVDMLARRVRRPASDPLVVDALRQATGNFRGAVGHAVTKVEADEVELDGNGAAGILLPAAPVDSIASVRVDGRPLPSSAYRVVKRSGILRRRDGAFWPRGAAVEVVYTHGHGSVPEDVSAAVLERAETIFNVLAGIQSNTVLGDSVTFSTSAIGSTQAWTDAVANYSLGRGDEA